MESEKGEGVRNRSYPQDFGLACIFEFLERLPENLVPLRSAHGVPGVPKIYFCAHLLIWNAFRR
jgi:hypothetical protein